VCGNALGYLGIARAWQLPSVTIDAGRFVTIIYWKAGKESRPPTLAQKQWIDRSLPRRFQIYFISYLVLDIPGPQPTEQPDTHYRNQADKTRREMIKNEKNMAVNVRPQYEARIDAEKEHGMGEAMLAMINRMLRVVIGARHATLFMVTERNRWRRQ